MTGQRDMEKAALRGEPSYVWRDGQRRRLDMILKAANERVKGLALIDGCGVGMYLDRMGRCFNKVIGLDIEYERLAEAKTFGEEVTCGVGEALPFPDDSFDFVLSHEVLEHVQDDHQTIKEIIRVLRPGGRLALFCPNRGYPFETHGIYWKGTYHFGNIPLVNYLPRAWRDRLAPHVNIYTRRDLKTLFNGLPTKIVKKTTIFGGYDNIIARKPRLGKMLRGILQLLEKTPFRRLGLSHFWIVEKT
jgi:SAM-dependent methyltransferase